jgi:2-polyprenyl-6-methoxyphenol hydroxylase-like FAD-dependent oxidoreductase
MQVDVAIIGSSIAGSTVAQVLGSAGVSVALIDKSTFPRRKPCGEGLSRAGIGILKRLGIWGDPSPIPTLPYDGYRIVTGSLSRIVEPRNGGGITVSRELLDNHLLNAASRHPSVTALLGCEVYEVTVKGTVETAAGTIHHTILVLADGANSPTARKLNIPSVRIGPPRAGASAIFKGKFSSAPKHVTIQVGKGYELYATPLPDGHLNLSILAQDSAGINIRTMLLDRTSQREIFDAVGFEGELELPPLGRASLGNVRRTSISPNLFLVGDAAEEFDPIGGMGMTHALHSAEVAAKAILKQLRRGSDSATTPRSYTSERAAHAAPLRRFTQLTGTLLRSCRTVPLLLRAVSSPLGNSLASRLLPKELPL